MNYHHILNIFVEARLDDTFNTIYNKRWDVWMIQNGYINEYMVVMLKDDWEIKQLMELSAQLANSPLMKALT